MTDCSVNKTNTTCNSVFTRRGAPSNSLGSNGDIFFSETAPFNWYKKVNNVWVMLGSLQNNGEIPTPIDSYTKTESDAKYGLIEDITKWEVDTEFIDYGFLYNRYAVDGGNLAPTCYRVPTSTDFYTLSSYLGITAGGILKSTRTSGIDNYPNWTASNIGATDIVRFSALPSGTRNSDGSYTNIGLYSFFWTSTTTAHWYISNNSDVITSYGASLKSGMSVRCLRDATDYEMANTVDGDSLGEVFDIDGNRYDTTIIGTQVWLTSNLKTTRYNDGTPIPRVDDPATWSGLTTGAYCIYNNGELSDYQDTIVLSDKIKPKSEKYVSAKHLEGIKYLINSKVKEAIRCLPRQETLTYTLAGDTTPIVLNHTFGHARVNMTMFVGDYTLGGTEARSLFTTIVISNTSIILTPVGGNAGSVLNVTLIGVDDECSQYYGAFCLGCENI